MIPIPPLRLGVLSPSNKSEKLSKPWNNGDKLLKKFIGNGPDGGTEMGAETQSGHGGPRLSMEARRRLEFAEELSE